MVDCHTLPRKENVLACHSNLLRNCNFLSSWSSVAPLLGVLTRGAYREISNFTGLMVSVSVLSRECQVHVAEHPLNGSEVLVAKTIVPFEKSLLERGKIVVIGFHEACIGWSRGSCACIHLSGMRSCQSCKRKLRCGIDVDGDFGSFVFLNVELKSFGVDIEGAVRV